MEGKEKKATLLFNAFIFLVLIGLLMFFGSRSISETLHVDYAIIDDTGFGLTLGAVICLILRWIVSIRRKKPAPAE